MTRADVSLGLPGLAVVVVAVVVVVVVVVVVHLPLLTTTTTTTYYYYDYHHHHQVFQRMEQVVKKDTGGREMPSFLSTHPSFQDRISRLQKEVDKARVIYDAQRVNSFGAISSRREEEEGYHSLPPPPPSSF